MTQVKFYRVETLPEVGEVGSLYFVYGITQKFYVYTNEGFELYSGGDITTEDVEVLPDEGLEVQAVTFIEDKSNSTNSSFTIKPNVKYIFGEREELTIQLNSPSNSSIVNHYMFEFISGDIATTLSLPTSIKWTTTPSIKANKIYQISIENNLGVIQEWE